jgi:hypothetical protein
MANDRDIEVEQLDNAIKMINTYVQDDSVKPLLTVLEAMKKDPDNQSLLKEFFDTFDELGITQGAVLTYAPYLNYLVSDHPFGSKGE